ncbi:hypothetical protein F4814DRAFT_331908 [Daldinia grandis]|nr:hypothetical protein F4814DRAFT_331908 [Daldinia grandis]
MQSDKLPEEAEYGKLPFDIFVCEKWDYSRATEEDQQQWNTLAREWLGLDAHGRHPYHELSYSNKTLLTTAQVERILIPRQTICERNLSARTHLGRYAPVWLRTCYSPELAETYAEWRKEDLEHLLGHSSQILDDEDLYASYADDWSRVLLRVPAIADTIRYTYETDDIVQETEEDFDRPGPGEEFKMAVFEAGRKEKTMFFLVDEQALRAGLVKILWLDIHGNCVWENRLDPHRLLEFRGRMFDGGSLADLYSECEYADTYQLGAVLEID